MSDFGKRKDIRTEIHKNGLFKNVLNFFLNVYLILLRIDKQLNKIIQ